MTSRKNALEALEYIQHDWQQKDGQATFQEQCDIIRAALSEETPELKGLRQALEASQAILFAMHEAERRPEAKKFLADRMTDNSIAMDAYDKARGERENG